MQPDAMAGAGENEVAFHLLQPFRRNFLFDVPDAGERVIQFVGHHPDQGQDVVGHELKDEVVLGASEVNAADAVPDHERHDQQHQLHRTWDTAVAVALEYREVSAPQRLVGLVVLDPDHADDLTGLDAVGQGQGDEHGRGELLGIIAEVHEEPRHVLLYEKGRPDEQQAENQRLQCHAARAPYDSHISMHVRDKALACKHISSWEIVIG